MNKAIIGKANNMKKGGFIKLISHDFCSQERHSNQNSVILSSIQIKKELGIETNSKKNTKEEMNKKQVKKGPKRSVLIGVKREIGSPHPIKKGKDIKEMNNCN